MKTSQGLKNSWRWGLSGSSGLSGRKSWDWNLCFFSATKRVVILLVFSCLKFKLLLFSERNRSFGSCPSEGISAWKFGLPTSEPSPVFEQLADHFFARRKGLVIRINAEGLTVAKGVSSLPYPTDNLESSQHGSSQLPSLTTSLYWEKVNEPNPATVCHTFLEHSAMLKIGSSSTGLGDTHQIQQLVKIPTSESTHVEKFLKPHSYIGREEV